jgi:hypothetical protein
MTNLRERFFEKVERDGEFGCWHWIGARDKKGYGRFRVGRRMHPAHRVAHELLRGPIPAGMTIDHTCRNTGCVNPLHFDIVTLRDNVRRGSNSLKKVCPQGHEYTEENTLKRRGKRECRRCERDRSERRRRKQGILPRR